MACLPWPVLLFTWEISAACVPSQGQARLWLLMSCGRTSGLQAHFSLSNHVLLEWLGLTSPRFLAL